ncbi:Caspase-1 [Frankliniella fusca]|uniref:Caspase-1 n=1 Tax=Frankliniella fusca TaxID=407009 RepID=A0AAE1L9F2_9NEOP|nr:Caspase-1 [Frankliniella fusca]
MASNEQPDTGSNGVSHPPVANGGGDQVDPPVPWLQYVVDSINRRPPPPSAQMPVERNAVYYNMNHKERGVALIFNHEHFEARLNLKSRSGTEHDCKNLERSLKALGFEPKVYHDLTNVELMNVIDNAANDNHSSRDCLIVAVLSHGEQGILYAKDSVYKPENLWTPFAADRCPTLAGKPKLFFIQACQGDKLDAGVTMLRATQTDSGSHSYKIPVHSDFLIAYSTIPGYYSWRNTSKGSWFMQALCQELSENGFVLDLLTILTFVNQRVALDYESNTPDNANMHQQKQIPCITYMLTRLVKFTRKSIH